MILQALNQYYERKAALGDGEIAPFGFSLEKIPVVFELDADGKVVQIKVTDRKEAKPQMVPQAIKKTAGIASNLLWENAEYALGICLNGDDRKTKRKHAAFVERVKSLPPPASEDKGINALLKFLDSFTLSDLEDHPPWHTLPEKPNVSFELQGDGCLICQRRSVIAIINKTSDSKRSKSICLITGDKEPIARLHASIKNVRNAQSSGAAIVSFNQASFASFGKKQGDNASVSEKASFAYTTALNHLLRYGSSQRMQVGDASVVFWAEKSTPFENQVSVIFSSTPKEIEDNPDAYTRSVKAVFDSVHQGRLQSSQSSNLFYVLGLSPNAARIAIRFWHVATISEMSQRIKNHFDYLEIVHSNRSLPYLPLSFLLKSIAIQGKSDNIPPNLAGEVMRSLLTGHPYPFTLLAAAIRRCKADKKMKVNYPRAALIKACLNSNATRPDEELAMTLDFQNTNSGYRLGRLFAVLEKIQEEAHPNIKATIRDRYYGAASSNPVSVFSTLLKLKNHHLSKLTSVGRKVNLEKLIGEIMRDIPPDFPTSLSLQDQGRFAVGYYHQRHDFFTSKPTHDPGDQS